LGSQLALPLVEQLVLRQEVQPGEQRVLVLRQEEQPGEQRVLVLQALQLQAQEQRLRIRIRRKSLLELPQLGLSHLLAPRFAR
jgi:hypothetical protein